MWNQLWMELRRTFGKSGTTPPNWRGDQ